MVPSEIAKRVEKWQQGYDRLVEISMKQLMLLKEEVDSLNLWDRLKSLNEEKESVQTELEHLQLQLEEELGFEKMRELFQKLIRTKAESARVLTFEASQKVEAMMLSTGKQIGSTRNQRKVFNAYNGYAMDGEISFYFDEKK